MKKNFSAALLLILVSATQFARADNNFFDLGYSPKSGNVLSAVGIGGYSLKDDGTGFFMNGAIAVEPTNYINSSTYGTVSERAEAPYMLNAGVTFSVMPSGSDLPLYKSIHSYVGIGYASLEGRAKDSWGYWGNETSRDKGGLNVTGGFILGFDSWGINLGVNSYTKTVYLGLGMKMQAK